MTLLERIIHSTGYEECKSQWHPIFIWTFQVERKVSHRNVFGNNRKGHELRSIHEFLFQAFSRHRMGLVNVKEIP